MYPYLGEFWFWPSNKPSPERTTCQVSGHMAFVCIMNTGYRHEQRDLGHGRY